MTKKMQTTQTTQMPFPRQERETRHLELAAEALLAGMTRQQVIAQLISRIMRDQGYLAYRKASGRRTRYDDQGTSDLRALALAAVFLAEDQEKTGAIVR